jgi:hypothetical protein
MSRTPATSRWWLYTDVPAPLVSGSSAVLSGDELFAQLDGRFLRVGSTGWRIEIFSVWADESRWIQLALRGPSEHMLMLRVPLAAAALDILDEIKHWLRHPDAAETVCNAAPYERAPVSQTIH